jgi:hypothetical protein
MARPVFARSTGSVLQHLLALQHVPAQVCCVYRKGPVHGCFMLPEMSVRLCIASLVFQSTTLGGVSLE